MTDASQASGVDVEALIREVKVLRLQPGDVVILKSNGLLASGQPKAQELIDRASVVFSRFVGFRVCVMVIPEGGDVDVLRSGDGTTKLPWEVAAEDALKPVPARQPGDNSFNVIKSKTPGPLAGVVDAMNVEDPGK